MGLILRGFEYHNQNRRRTQKRGPKVVRSGHPRKCHFGVRPEITEITEKSLKITGIGNYRKVRNDQKSNIDG
jgi:hypothetical protein